jgi:hypothetical protein
VHVRFDGVNARPHDRPVVHGDPQSLAPPFEVTLELAASRSRLEAVLVRNFDAAEVSGEVSQKLGSTLGPSGQLPNASLGEVQRSSGGQTPGFSSRVWRLVGHCPVSWVHSPVSKSIAQMSSR